MDRIGTGLQRACREGPQEILRKITGFAKDFQQPAAVHLYRKKETNPMQSGMKTLIASAALLGSCYSQAQQTKPATPAEGYNIHVSAPHVVNAKLMGPFHHYCKVIPPEPVSACLIYDSTDANAQLIQVEYIIAKSLTRPAVSRESWNQYWHDHQQEIATGRVQVHDLPPDKAKEVADLV